MKVIVGLGNPGPKYAGTRHNVGFDVIDYLANGPGVGSARERFEALISETKEGDETVLLVKPLTFMNLSGRAVRAILDFYKVPVENLLVICDDLNLPLGKLRMRIKGSHGGQNGLRNIQEQLGTDAYCRLRVGLGQPAVGDAVEFVLGKFKPGERAAAEEAVVTAAQAALVWAKQGAEASMNRFNGGSSDDGGAKEKGKGPKAKKAKDEPPQPQ
ncbi:aminoacyl-tRNA hydrolase [Gemmata sp. JC717]|uniref:aminoacyl-tRNA hydrolase n=1 Tax=Gemmata algarum TaxID=2975278 RepID=UPI0021BABC97|nr:aminoacyl-tRNA hydrolase [Gemmata algarum]MDY3553274.1 aminoacyl-tRNA hydrolase [Gemmata algarum]